MSHSCGSCRVGYHGGCDCPCECNDSGGFDSIDAYEEYPVEMDGWDV